MAKNEVNTWKPDNDVHVTHGTAITSMVIYAECSELISYDAQYSDENASKKDTINLAIGRTKLYIPDESNDKQAPLIISPFKVEYEKEIYRPGMVKILTHVTGGNHLQYAKKLDRLFLNSECRMNLVTWSPEKKKYIFVAQSYYLDHLSIDRDADNAVVATLVCYSPDYKMTLDKFCQAYTGQCFATQILTNGIARFDNTAKLSLDTRDLMFLTYDKKNSDVKALSKNPSENNRMEMIQAYLLQYNESFYDFICRIANRCGEFLYYEDGMLHLGLPEATRSIMDMSSKSMTVLYPHGVSYPKLKSKVKSGLKTGTFLYDPTSATNMAPEAGICYMAAHNAPNNTTYKDFKIPDINMFQDGHFMAAILSAFASSTSAGEALGSVAFTGAMEAINTQIDKHKFSFRGIQRQVYDKLLENLKLQPMNSETVALKDNLTQEFFSQIRQLEEQVTDDMITMDFDNKMPDTSLAGAVTIDDGFDNAFVVTKMKGVFLPGQQSHTITAVPRVSAEGKLSRTTDTGQALLVPPVLATDATLGTAPMEAVVKVAYDPYRIGRVRVKFLWQAEDDMQDPNISDWIPMSTPFAGQKGNGGGIFMMPQSGTHVIVNFIDNDIYHPYISGSLYNKNQEAPGYGVEYGSLPLVPMPYSPANNVMTIQSANGHGITFSDDGNIDMISDVLCPSLGAMVKSAITIDKSREETDETYNPALNSTTLDNITKNWGQHKSGGITLADRAGFYNISMSSSKREIEIKCPLGKINMNAFTGINISAPNGDINIEGKNVSISAGSNLSLKAGTNVQAFGEDKVIFGNSLIGTLVGSSTGYAATMLTSFATKEGHALDRVFDFNFLRSTWEVLLRPVEGTLSLSTIRNITMTAGFGNTVVPAYLQSNVTSGFLKLKDDKKEEYKQYTYRQRLKNELEADEMASLISIVKDAKACVLDFYTRAYTSAQHVRDAVCSLRNSLLFLNEENLKSGDVLLPLFKNKVCLPEQDIYEEVKTISLKPKPQDPIAQQCWKDMSALKTMIKDMNRNLTLQELAEKVTKDIEKIKIKNKSLSLSAKDIGANKKICDDLFVYIDHNMFVTDEEAFKRKIKIAQRNAFFALISQVDTYAKVAKVNVEDDDAWKKFTTDLSNFPPQPSTRKMFGMVAKTAAINAAANVLNLDSLLKLVNADTATQQAININGKMGAYAFADVSTGGSILMSNNPGYTYQMNLDGTSFKEYENVTLTLLQSIIS